MKAPLGLLVLVATLGGRAWADEAGGDEKGFREVVVVTAARTEQPLGDVVAFMSLLSRPTLEEAPKLTLDDHLRRIPGFGLLRRSGSLVAHPTSQGVSLRGIGTSGASRTLVLLDGLPLNDPFGGWIQWNRVPLLAIDAVEVVRGSASALYGNASMGGTIEVRSLRPSISSLSMRAQGGSRGTYDVEGRASGSAAAWAGLLAVRAFGTDGYTLVDEAVRGPVDIPARSLFRSVLGTAARGGFRAQANLFDERRVNGTPLQRNHSRLGLVSAGFEAARWSLRGSAQWGRFENRFSRILPRRLGEVQTAEEDTHADALGGAFAWRPQPRLLAGVDWRHVASAGRSQDLAGVFGQRLLALDSRFDLLLGLRLDAWKSEEMRTGVNPRAGVLFRASQAWTLRASGYRGFRAPTLNELYRPFRVGNIETRANPLLDEESLWGTEAGADFHPSPELLVRANVFWSALRDPIGNVTLEVTPTEVLRQRRNLDGARTWGTETEVLLRHGHQWSATASYLFADARVSGGKRIPQIPRHQGTLSASWRGPITVTAEGRFSSRQFEDDLNTLPLGGYAVLDLYLSRSVSTAVRLFVAAENVFDRSYAVGRTPVATLGTPRIVHGGIQLGR